MPKRSPYLTCPVSGALVGALFTLTAVFILVVTVGVFIAPSVGVYCGIVGLDSRGVSVADTLAVTSGEIYVLGAALHEPVS